MKTAKEIVAGLGNRLERMVIASSPKAFVLFVKTVQADAIKGTAAPELLEACKNAVLKWQIRTDLEFRRHGLPMPEPERPDWIKQCDAAIAKAEGKTP